MGILDICLYRSTTVKMHLTCTFVPPSSDIFNQYSCRFFVFVFGFSFLSLRISFIDIILSLSIQQKQRCILHYLDPSVDVGCLIFQSIFMFRFFLDFYQKITLRGHLDICPHPYSAMRKMRLLLYVLRVHPCDNHLNLGCLAFSIAI